MRNLKRALSLALASVMLLGMMVVGTSAKGLEDFGDAAEITNADAVAVTSEIGIFEGYDDGEFKPAASVTRAQMAVIIAKMLYGADVKADQFAEIDTFTDVPAWAEGYVNLVASLGIVAGRGNGIFDPNATVTTAEAAMMLTKALGYFQNAKDFGDNWELAATAKATELGLYGDMKLSAKAALNRENVAVMVFNALTKAVPVQYNELLGVYYNENQGIIYSLEFNYLQTLGYKNFDLVYKTNTETMYGRPATTWGFGSYNVNTSASTTTKTDLLTENGGLIASKVRMLSTDEIITIANVPTYVYTESVDEDEVYKDLGKSVCDGDYNWVAYVNGDEVAAKDVDVPDKIESEYVYTGEGTVTEIYIDDADEIVTVVEINYYLGEVSKVKSDDDGEYVIVNTLSDGAKELDDKTFYVEGYAEDDLIVFTMDINDDGDAIIAEVFDPATVTGEVTRVEKDKDNTVSGATAATGETYVRVNGEKYIYAEDAADPEQQSHIVYDLDDMAAGKKHPTLNEEYTLYLDPNGYVLAFEITEETVDQYLFVRDSDEEMEDWRAKVELTDGTLTTVDVDADLAKVPATKMPIPYHYEISGSNADTGFSTGDVEWIDNTGEIVSTKNVTNIEKLIWKYSVGSDGVYDLTYVTINNNKTSDEAQWAMDDAEIKNGKAYVTDGNNTFIVDKKTVFVDTVNNTTYTGYTEVPNVEKAELAYVLNGKVADVVFILAGEIYDEASVYFMLAGTNRESLKYDGENYWEYSKAYVNGEKTTLTVNYDADDSANDTVLDTAPVLYQVKKTIDEIYITEVVKVQTDKYAVDAVGLDAFWIDNDTYENTQYEYLNKFDTNEDTIFVVVELDADGKTYSIYDGDIADMDEDLSDPDCDYSDVKVQVVKEDEQTAELVYIYKTEKSATGGNNNGTPAQQNLLNTVKVNGRGAVVANGYETVEDAVANATPIIMTVDSTQTYTFDVTTVEVGAQKVPAYGAYEQFDSVAAAKGCTLAKGDETANGLNGQTITFQTAAEGNCVVMMTENFGTITYYAYYLAK